MQWQESAPMVWWRTQISRRNVQLGGNGLSINHFRHLHPVNLAHLHVVSIVSHFEVAGKLVEYLDWRDLPTSPHPTHWTLPWGIAFHGSFTPLPMTVVCNLSLACRKDLVVMLHNRFRRTVQSSSEDEQRTRELLALSPGIVETFSRLLRSAPLLFANYVSGMLRWIIDRVPKAMTQMHHARSLYWAHTLLEIINHRLYRTLLTNCSLQSVFEILPKLMRLSTHHKMFHSIELLQLRIAMQLDLKHAAMIGSSALVSERTSAMKFVFGKSKRVSSPTAGDQFGILLVRALIIGTAKSFACTRTRCRQRHRWNASSSGMAIIKPMVATVLAWFHSRPMLSSQWHRAWSQHTLQYFPEPLRRGLCSKKELKEFFSRHCLPAFPVSEMSQVVLRLSLTRAQLSTSGQLDAQSSHATVDPVQSASADPYIPLFLKRKRSQGTFARNEKRPRSSSGSPVIHPLHRLRIRDSSGTSNSSRNSRRSRSSRSSSNEGGVRSSAVKCTAGSFSVDARSPSCAPWFRVDLAKLEDLKKMSSAQKRTPNVNRIRTLLSSMCAAMNITNHSRLSWKTVESEWNSQSCLQHIGLSGFSLRSILAYYRRASVFECTLFLSVLAFQYFHCRSTGYRLAYGSAEMVLIQLSPQHCSDGTVRLVEFLFDMLDHSLHGDNDLHAVLSHVSVDSVGKCLLDLIEDNIVLLDRVLLAILDCDDSEFMLPLLRRMVCDDSAITVFQRVEQCLFVNSSSGKGGSSDSGGDGRSDDGHSEVPSWCDDDVYASQSRYFRNAYFETSTVTRMTQKPGTKMTGDTACRKLHLPVYYSNGCVNMIGAVDMVIGRLIELSVLNGPTPIYNRDAFELLLETVDRMQRVYRKFHQTPVSFVHDTLMYYDDCSLLDVSARLRIAMLCLHPGATKESVPHPHMLLTNTFRRHWLAAIQARFAMPHSSSPFHPRLPAQRNVGNCDEKNAAYEWGRRMRDSMCTVEYVRELLSELGGTAPCRIPSSYFTRGGNYESAKNFSAVPVAGLHEFSSEFEARIAIAGIELLCVPLATTGVVQAMLQFALQFGVPVPLKRNKSSHSSEASTSPLESYEKDCKLSFQEHTPETSEVSYTPTSPTPLVPPMPLIPPTSLTPLTPLTPLTSLTPLTPTNDAHATSSTWPGAGSSAAFCSSSKAATASTALGSMDDVLSLVHRIFAGALLLQRLPLRFLREAILCLARTSLVCDGDKLPPWLDTTHSHVHGFSVPSWYHRSPHLAHLAHGVHNPLFLSDMIKDHRHVVPAPVHSIFSKLLRRRMFSTDTILVLHAHMLLDSAPPETFVEFLDEVIALLRADRGKVVSESQLNCLLLIIAPFAAQSHFARNSSTPAARDSPSKSDTLFMPDLGEVIQPECLAKSLVMLAMCVQSLHRAKPNLFDTNVNSMPISPQDAWLAARRCVDVGHVFLSGSAVPSADTYGYESLPVSCEQRCTSAVLDHLCDMFSVFTSLCRPHPPQWARNQIDESTAQLPPALRMRLMRSL